MVARFCHRKEPERDCRQSRRNRERAVASFERRHRALKIGGGRQSMQAVADARIFSTLGRLKIGDALEEHCRRAIDRRVDRAEMLLRIAAEMGDAGCGTRLAPPAHTVERSAAAIWAACA